VIQGESGMAAINAGADGAPRYLPMAVSDKVCGHVLASAIGMALFARERSGEGQEVHVPMMETMTAFNLVDHLWHGVLGEPEKGLGYPRMFTPYRRPYATSDGHVCLLATTDRQWRNLFRAIDRPEMAEDSRFATIAGRTAHIDELYTLLAERMRTRTTAEWRARLDAHDVPSGGVNDLKGLVADPYLRDTGFFHPVEHPSEGPTVTMAIPVAFSRSPGSLRLPPPRRCSRSSATALRRSPRSPATRRRERLVAVPPPPVRVRPLPIVAADLVGSEDVPEADTGRLVVLIAQRVQPLQFGLVSPGLRVGRRGADPDRTQRDRADHQIANHFVSPIE
jgi:crotonobetainyl-CoA:carnitine CoA-transferase CaiB-like acyl-CoA transferase